MILTIDFGTSVTKVGLWEAGGPVAMARAELTTSRPDIGRAEQEPFGWWTSVVVACAEARAAAPGAFDSVQVVGCSGARQSFVPVTAGAEPLGRAILWSDRRAADEAGELAAAGGGHAAVRARTGVPLDAGSVAAKVAWLERHEPGRLAASDWLLAPRDLIVWRLTGELATDTTLASRTGLYDLEGQLVPGLAGAAAGRLPPVVPPDTVVGRLRAVPAASLGLPAGLPVVIGAGDRPCEVLGAGARATCPMVSWGTTANVSVPTGDRPPRLPDGLVLSRAADGGWILEGGLSAAGSLLAWLGQLVGREPAELSRLAMTSEPGARGVVATPWLDGARAPWWRDDARAAFVGLASVHDAGDLARAAIESVAWDVSRCLCALGTDGDPPRLEGLTLAGSGASLSLWTDVLTSVTGLPAYRRRSDEAASAGAALLAARAVGLDVELDGINPLAVAVEPDPAVVARYDALRPGAARVAAALVGLTDRGGGST